MNTFYRTIFISLLSIIALSSCSKYDEGGWPIRSEKNLYSTNWKLETNNTQSSTIELTFSENGDFTRSTSYLDDTTYIRKGSWELIEDKQTILITLPSNISNEDYVALTRLDMGMDYDKNRLNKITHFSPYPEGVVYPISKLTKNDFWYTTNTTIFKFKPI